MNDEVITSLQNPRVKAVVRLRERRSRDRSGRILIDGRREIARALDAGVRFVEVFYCRGMLRADDEDAFLRPARRAGGSLVEVNEAVFGRIGYGDRAEGVVVVAERPERSLDDLHLDSPPLVGIVEGIEKPGNLGAILRSADGAGVDAIVAVEPITDIYGPNAIRASLGTVFTVPLAAGSPGETLAWVRARGLSLVAASPAGGVMLTDVNMAGPTAIIFGAEAAGLTQTWDRAGLVHATIPMLGRADSLNVATTAALFFYEALRQRRARA
ncbi:MAG: RNA methyltransferase [Planctomycetota bacterium]